MKKVLVVVSFACVILFSCNSNDTKDSGVSSIKAEGGKAYGGVLRVNENEYFKNLFPHSIIDAISYRVASQVYEGLFTFDQSDLSLKNALCENYEMSDDGLNYTFKIKKGVVFHDDDCFEGGKGRELNANDIKYCFTLLCTQSRNNQGFSIFDGLVKGANEYYDASADGTPDFDVEGFKVVDEYTLEIALVKRSNLFLKNLARPVAFIFPKEAYESYGLDMREMCVGTGPFKLASIDDDISVILKRNPNYHRKDEHGNQLPFLEAVHITFIKDKKTELFEFKKGNLDMIYRLPTEHIIEIMEASTTQSGEFSDFVLQRDPEMMTHFLAFLNQSDLFKDVNVRKAFSFAVDREKILDFVLNGEGYAPGNHGLTPPTFDDYDIESIKGYSYNVDSAKYYLSKAGYASGKGFPKLTLDLNAGGERNTNVAMEVIKQLKDNLNIEVEPNIVPFAQHVENMQNAKSLFFRAAWSADIPTPENFLWLFYGKTVPESLDETSYPNIMRYKNSKFDELYEAAINSNDDNEANQLFMQAEQVAMNDAPIMVLWYDEGYRLLQSNIKDLPNNPMQFRDFSGVYIEQAQQLNEASASN